MQKYNKYLEHSQFSIDVTFLIYKAQIYFSPYLCYIFSSKNVYTCILQNGIKQHILIHISFVNLSPKDKTLVLLTLITTKYQFLNQRACVLSCSVMFDCLQHNGLQPARLHYSWDFPTKIQEWVAISSSRGSSWDRDQTCVSCGSCMAGRLFTIEPPLKPVSFLDRNSNVYE